MPAGLKHHFGTAEHGLSSEPVSLSAWDTVTDRAVRHCLDDHKNIGR